MDVKSSFHKNRVYEPHSNAYVERFILECNYGVAIHFVGALLGFLIIFLFPLSYACWIGLPIALVNLWLNLLPMFALRYNLPKLEALYALNARREQQAATVHPT